MKRLFSCIMAMLLFCGMILPVWAETDLPDAQVPLAEIPTGSPVTEAPGEETQQPTGNTQPEEPKEEAGQLPEEPTGTAAAPETCVHSWVYAEVKPTCTEYGAKGYVCVYCEGITDVVTIAPVPHSYDNACDTDCNACGTGRSVTHKFSSAWSKNSTQHWHACDICGEKSDVGGHYPGPAATEEKAQYCLTCGLMMMPQKAHTHVYAVQYTSDGSEHWYACEGCAERKSVEIHSYDDPCDPDCNVCGHTTEKSHETDGWQSDENGHWTVCSLCAETTAPERHTPRAELTDTGAQYCEVCGFELSAGPGHSHASSGDWDSNDGSHWKLCECGEKLEEELHRWDREETGEETLLYTCTVCGAERTEQIPQTDSALPWWIPAVMAALLCGAIALVVLLILGKRKGIF